MRFSAETGKATRIFYSIPGQLYKNASRYQVSGVLENGKIDRIESILQDIITLAFWDKDVTENVIYQKLLSDKLSAYLGYVYENMVGQMLKSQGYELYHTWPTESGKHNYEIDFLISSVAK